jgi:hypothetical protein
VSLSCCQSCGKTRRVLVVHAVLSVSFPARAALRDSWLRPSDLRETVLALLSRAFFTRVPPTTHGPSGSRGRRSRNGHGFHATRADRTPSRPLLTLFTRIAAMPRSRALRQPVAAWTITRGVRTTIPHVRRAHKSSLASPQHLANRSEPRAESPHGLSRAAFDETRNTHQCDAPRNARRHTRGRSARRAAG